MSLFGKVIGDKVINVTGVKNFVNHIYGYPKDIKVLEIGGQSLSIFFLRQASYKQDSEGQTLYH